MTIARLAWPSLAIQLLAGCGARGEPEPGTPPAAERAATAQVPDSLILNAPGGVTVWLTEGRRGADTAGASCLERTLEIRRDTTRIKVPLLYTITAPTLVNDSTLRAALAHNCQPGDLYLVNLHTGRPTPLRTPEQ
jgi:hypothetical protein